MDVREVTLRGRHVVLEPLRVEHVRELWEAASEPEVWTYMGYVVDAPRDLERWVRDRLAAVAAGTALAFVQRDAATGTAFGSTSLFDIERRHRRMEIGHTWIGRTHRRTAVNTEAKFMLLQHAFELLDASRVQLKTDAENLRSQAAIERIGATREGVLRAWTIDERGKVRDRVFFSILAAEWPDRKARLEAMLRR